MWSGLLQGRNEHHVDQETRIALYCVALRSVRVGSIILTGGCNTSGVTRHVLELVLISDNHVGSRFQDRVVVPSAAIDMPKQCSYEG